jgi:hypothetical protein
MTFDQELMAGERLKGKWLGKERLWYGFFGTGRLDDSGGVLAVKAGYKVQENAGRGCVWRASF